MLKEIQLKTSDIMTMGEATVRESDPALRAIELLLDHRISALPVLDAAGKVKGILTETNFFRADTIRPAELLALPLEARREKLSKQCVQEVMTPACITIGPDVSVVEAFEIMMNHALKHLPVMTDGKVIGLVSRADILRVLVEGK